MLQSYLEKRKYRQINFLDKNLTFVLASLNDGSQKDYFLWFIHESSYLQVIQLQACITMLQIMIEIHIFFKDSNDFFSTCIILVAKMHYQLCICEYSEEYSWKDIIHGIQMGWLWFFVIVHFLKIRKP